MMGLWPSSAETWHGPPQAPEQGSLLGKPRFGEGQKQQMRPSPGTRCYVNPRSLALETPLRQLFPQLEPRVQMSRKLLSAPEIAHLKGNSREQPINQKSEG